MDIIYDVFTLNRFNLNVMLKVYYGKKSFFECTCDDCDCLPDWLTTCKNTLSVISLALLLLPTIFFLLHFLNPPCDLITLRSLRSSRSASSHRTTNDSVAEAKQQPAGPDRSLAVRYWRDSKSSVSGCAPFSENHSDVQPCFCTYWWQEESSPTTLMKFLRWGLGKPGVWRVLYKSVFGLPYTVQFNSVYFISHIHDRRPAHQARRPQTKPGPMDRLRCDNSILQHYACEDCIYIIVHLYCFEGWWNGPHLFVWPHLSSKTNTDLLYNVAFCFVLLPLRNRRTSRTRTAQSRLSDACCGMMRGFLKLFSYLESILFWTENYFEKTLGYRFCLLHAKCHFKINLCVNKNGTDSTCYMHSC